MSETAAPALALPSQEMHVAVEAPNLPNLRGEARALAERAKKSWEAMQVLIGKTAIGPIVVMEGVGVTYDTSAMTAGAGVISREVGGGVIDGFVLSRFGHENQSKRRMWAEIGILVGSAVVVQKAALHGANLGGVHGEAGEMAVQMGSKYPTLFGVNSLLKKRRQGVAETAKV